MQKIRAKKSLGQNFLTSRELLQRIVDSAELKETDTVLEVGPGKGDLTSFLLSSSKRVIAIEKDHRLIEGLNKKFALEISSQKLILIHDDILKINVRKVFEENKTPLKYKLVANIPYYITGKLISNFLSQDYQPEMMVVMLQKEVAERIIAKDGKESILSLSVKAYGTPTLEFNVTKDNFDPAPKVDSSVLAIKNISKNFFKNNPILEKKFFSLVKQGFSSKRRKLTNNLKPSFKNAEEIVHLLKKLDLEKDIRAEKLTLKDWQAFLG